MNKPLKFVSLFAGIGGFDLGFERAGMFCVGQVEIDPFCRKVLRMRRRGGSDLWSYVSEATDHGSGIGSAIVELYLPEANR